ncbi:hypothetical protein FGL95_30255 [Nocardiaceae bacterium YC2-7]|uniref:Uncharacterized protein n=1 Tax=Antrihabitans stalactiti TaxID=2584121 RepID=A0A848KSW9_9NOCA|nr:hypothetical protein [Antrihabitans stalactiti]
MLAEPGVPNPPAKDLPGDLGTTLDTWLGYGKTICNYAAAAGILAIVVMLFVGVRGRSTLAKDALTHLPWVILGEVLLVSGATLF